MLLPASFWGDSCGCGGESCNGDVIWKLEDFFIEIGGFALTMFGCDSWGNEYGVVVFLLVSKL